MKKLFSCLAVILFQFVIYQALLTYLDATPLDDYVKRPDPFYKYKLLRVLNRTDQTIYVINMTSQKWLDKSLVSQPIWWHYLTIFVPKKLKITNNAFLFINDKNNRGAKFPSLKDQDIKLTSNFSKLTGAISVNLRQVPNQPIVFKSDSTKKPRYEDSFMSWTWKQVIENGTTAEMISLLPMTKAAYKAMDTAVDFCSKKRIAKLEKFMVSGASKRGWISWLIGAVDNKRVFAIIPIIYDLLNFGPALHHHFKSLGGWSFSLADYYESGITKYIDSEIFNRLVGIIDPAAYYDRYSNMKILIVKGSNDGFFLIDQSYFYWRNLYQATNKNAWMNILPNTGHMYEKKSAEVLNDAVSFFLHINKKISLPSLDWVLQRNNTHSMTRAVVDITQGPAPVSVNVYVAESEVNRRDFRNGIIDSAGPFNLRPNNSTWRINNNNLRITKTPSSVIYETTFKIPTNKTWLGFFIKFNFDDPRVLTSLNLSTEVNVVPNDYPHYDCYRQTCYGKLV